MNETFFIVGPTAVGKTSLALELAEQFDAEIVNADAFQIYCGLDLLTAKPDSDAQRRVRHHLLGQVSLAETMSAVRSGTNLKSRRAIAMLGRTVLAPASV